jgi:hypothetical protein
VGSLNSCWPVVDQATMTTPGVSHPSTTTVEDFHRVCRATAFTEAIRAAEPMLRRLVPER